MALAIEATPNGSFDFKFVSFTENGSFVSHAVHKDVVATSGDGGLLTCRSGG